MAVSLQARVVFPVDRPPIEHGIVTIDGERIVAVGTRVERGKAIDLGAVALLPGLVNAHSHLEFSHLRQPLGGPGIGIVDWIRLVIADRQRTIPEKSESISIGLRESLGYGVTTIGDIATSPMSGFLCGKIDLTLFHEVIGFSRARANSALEAVLERIDSVSQALTGVGMDIDARTQDGLSPHAPYTVSPILLSKLVTLASARDMPLAMHLAESREELAFLHNGRGPFEELLDERSMWDAEAVPRGSRPLDYLQLLADAPRTLVIHGNYLVEEELSFLSAHRARMSLVYCPRTHAYFQHAAYPLVKAFAAGVRIALGTDSRASNPDLELITDMRYAARMHPAMEHHEVLRMGTLAGAEALGRDAEVGSLTPGKLANMIAIPLPDAVQGGPSEVLTAIFDNDWPASSVWLRGENTSTHPN